MALAILLRLADRATAERFYQAFKWECIAPMPDTDFSMPVRGWLDRKQRESHG